MSHAMFSPSAASRWTVCTAAPGKELNLPDSTTDAADTGSLYHAVAELMLRMLTTPALAAGKATKAKIEKALPPAYETIYATGIPGEISPQDAKRLMDKGGSEDGAAEHVTPYVLWVIENFGKLIADTVRRNVGSFGVEGVAQVVSVDEDVWGTVDFWAHAKGVLDVVDLKTGRFAVSPIGNLQLVLYALGTLDSLTEPEVAQAHTVRMTIFQHGEPETWEIKTTELRSFERMFRLKVREGKMGGETHAGDHCRFCKAKTDCRAYSDHNLSLARSEFSDLPLTASKEDAIQVLNNMPGHVAADFLNKFAEIEVFMKTALGVLAERAFADGLEVPGYKVIRGTKHKAWNDKAEAEAQLGDDAMKSTIITPTQAVKKLGAEACEGLWTTPTGEVKLVTLATRGKPVTRSAEIEFAD